MRCYLLFQRAELSLQCEDALITEAGRQVNLLVTYWHLNVNWLCCELFQLMGGQKIDGLLGPEVGSIVDC